MSSVHNPAFPIEEYRMRLSKVQSAMAENGLDAFLITDRADVCYLSGMENCYMVPYYAVVIRAVGDPLLIVSDFEMLNALVGVWFADRIPFAVNADPIEVTTRVFLERGFGKGRIGVQPEAMTARAYRSIEQHLPDALLVDAGDLLDPIEVIKSPAEIAYMREAGRLTTLGMEAAMEEVAPGKTDNDVAAAASDALIRAGSEFMCIEPIVTVGSRSGIPHSTFRRTPIRPGDSIFLEVGACVCRYSSPLMRTVAVSPVSDGIQRAADACRASLDVLVAHMRPGAVGHEVAAKAKEAWMPICEELIWHGIYAYSVGIGFPPDWNDTPLCLTEDSDDLLRPGMCFHATVSLRKAAEYGTAMSETVLITENGNEVLTGVVRELRVV
ncbi:MAG: Xaa-Pro peptidase family protein [Candidatus Latescibacterota bacterium]